MTELLEIIDGPADLVDEKAGPGSAPPDPRGRTEARMRHLAATASILLPIFAAGCGRSEPAVDAAPAAVAMSREERVEDAHSSDDPAAVAELRLLDVARDAGIDFIHRSGAVGAYQYPEIVTGGACLADFDGDGDLDAYLPQAGPIPGTDPAAAMPGRNALYLGDGRGGFTPAPDGSGADDAGYGNGAFAADIDADGDLDLLLTNTGSIRLLRNDGDARFTDISDAGGLGDRTGIWLNAAFGDFDGDGDLDAYVANYSEWTPGADRVCSGTDGRPDYCNPKHVPGAADLFLLGDGRGGFIDASARAGIDGVRTRSMGVVILDIEPDGDLDLYVANDGEANLLWVNDGAGAFTDEAMLRGCAFDGAGRPEAGMGVAVADVDRDGDEDLIVSHLLRETHTLYRNDGGVFTDATANVGLAWTGPDTGFGIGLPDFDFDGRPDVYVANGGVMRPARPLDPSEPYAIADRAVRQQADGRFRANSDVRAPDGGGVSPPDVARGAAFGDVDGDGDIDVLVSAKDGPARLLRNDTMNVGRWIGLRPLERAGGRPVPGTRVRRVIAGSADGVLEGPIATVRPHGSYLGSFEETIRFGLGAAPPARGVEIEITWMDGGVERFAGLEPGRVHVLVRGSGGERGERGERGDRLAGAGPDTVRPGDAATSAHGSRDATVLAAIPPMPRIPGALAAGPMPPISVERVDMLRERARLDHDAFVSWALRAGLPEPPPLAGWAASNWERGHAAYRAAAEAPGPRTLGELAMHFHGHGPEDAARAAYRAAIGFAPEGTSSGRWWHLLGALERQVGDVESAIAAFGRARERDPDEAATLASLGEALLAAGRADEAVEVLNRHTEIRPDEPWTVFHLALAHEARGDVDAARAAVARALVLAPASKPVLVLAGRLAVRGGDADAIADLERRIATAPETGEVPLPDRIIGEMRAFARTPSHLRRVAITRRAQSDLAGAYGVLLELARQSPDGADVHKTLTRLALDLGRTEDAARHAEAAVTVDPAFAPGWELLARARTKRGDTEGALAAARRAVEADPSYAQGIRTAAVMLAERRAWGELEAMLAPLDGPAVRDAAIPALRSLALANLGRVESAREAAVRALAMDSSQSVATQVLDAIGR